jgi:hypothetical protein
VATVEPVAYQVCLLPEDDPDASHYTVRIERVAVRPDRWAVRNGARTYNFAAGVWDFSPPHGSPDHRTDLPDALFTAQTLAPMITVNGKNVHELLDWREAQ